MNHYYVGQTASMAKTLSENDVYLFAGITGDFNPAHVNAEYAKHSLFKKRVAHGILSSGLISAVIGTKLPGPGTIYMGQTLEFRAPVYIGDTVTAKVSIKEIDEEKGRATLITECVNQDDKTVITGEAKVLLPTEE